MRAAIPLMLGFLLALALVFGWFGTPHQLDTRWKAPDRGLHQVDVAGEPIAR